MLWQHFAKFLIVFCRKSWGSPRILSWKVAFFFLVVPAADSLRLETQRARGGTRSGRRRGGDPGEEGSNVTIVIIVIIAIVDQKTNLNLKRASLITIITIITIVTSGPFPRTFRPTAEPTMHQPQAKTRGAAEVPLMLWQHFATFLIVFCRKSWGSPRILSWKVAFFCLSLMSCKQGVEQCVTLVIAKMPHKVWHVKIAS
jgi:hypothetical protein